MTLTAFGKYHRTNGKMNIYVPNAIVNDSQNPLNGKSGKVKIVIQDGKLVITPT